MELKHFKLTPEEIRSFTAPKLSYLPSAVVEYGKIETSIREQIEALDELAAPEVIQKRQQRFGPNLAPSLFEERLVRYKENKLVIAGLRFRKLNPEFPFVHLTGNFLFDDDDLSFFREAITRQFFPLKVRGMTFRQSPAFKTMLSIQNWSHTVFGKTSSGGQTVLPSKIKVAWEKSVQFYAEYKKEYQAYLASEPLKQNFLRLEEQEDLQESADKQLLLSVYDEKGWAGVIAGREDDLYGLPCLYIFEIFLVERLRKQRLAGSLQRHFLNELSSRFSHIFGQIDESNQPSLKTALSANRTIVESEFFLPFS